MRTNATSVNGFLQEVCGEIRQGKFCDAFIVQHAGRKISQRIPFPTLHRFLADPRALVCGCMSIFGSSIVEEKIDKATYFLNFGRGFDCPFHEPRDRHEGGW